MGTGAAPTIRPGVVAGLILGVGLGGFVDGIVLHQVLQWHHMLTAYDGRHYPATTITGLQVNTLWDGIFHASTWVATVLGVGMLWRAAGARGVRWSARVLVGAMAAGWGGFNLVEGIIDHQILGIHHVRDDLDGPFSWDVGFLVVGALLVVVGWLFIRWGAGARKSEIPARVR